MKEVGETIAGEPARLGWKWVIVNNSTLTIGFVKSNIPNLD